jgi:hypothetical protein
MTDDAREQANDCFAWDFEDDWPEGESVQVVVPGNLREQFTFEEKRSGGRVVSCRLVATKRVSPAQEDECSE